MTKKMKSLLAISWSLVVVILLSEGFTIRSSSAAASALIDEEEDDEGYRKLVEWVISHGGRVDERMAIGQVDGGIRGVIALGGDIENGTELMHCPWKLVIGSSSLQDQMETEDDMCNVVKILASEFRLGDQSLGWRYLNHIDEELPRLGAMWDSAAVQELQGLPPSHDLNRHNEWFSKNCGGGNELEFDKATKQALVSFISRASAVGMIPIYDLLNHHNGLKNAKLFTTEEGVDLRTVRRVQKGEQLYQSYGLKPSSQMFRDYGFVESWPTLWSWKHPTGSSGDNHVFALFPDGIAAIYPSVEFLKEIWASSTTRSQLEWQQNATHFTQSVPRDALMQFTTAAKTLLDGLPTTWEEDKEILKQKEAEQRIATTSRRAANTNVNHDEDNNSNHSDEWLLALEDVIAAIQYRLDFKRAVSDSSDFAEITIQGLEKTNEL
ncbi:Rubisco LSMT substrate-binding [Seminavis robusta]|uniref:Rubisco LSMT substrate-binding n=1 Tax=Seminavis robusta TaxID=568900 RepID=A0A9N8HP46_9STRA|nr:Rubisco LSMT substrate-binding [Seminavis robusta]|eukprot:Sro873_g214010.1 Rubisco LSMT substrate-binding (437) ;mRNA; f:10783-12093